MHILFWAHFKNSAFYKQIPFPFKEGYILRRLHSKKVTFKEGYIPRRLHSKKVTFQEGYIPRRLLSKKVTFQEGHIPKRAHFILITFPLEYISKRAFQKQSSFILNRAHLIWADPKRGTFQKEQIPFWSYSKRTHFILITAQKGYVPKKARSILITFQNGHILFWAHFILTPF